MKMEQIEALIRALINESEQAQREILGTLLRDTLQMGQVTSDLTKYITHPPLMREIAESLDKHIQGPKQAQEKKTSNPWDDFEPRRRAQRTEEEIRRDGFELARRFESEVYQAILHFTERYSERMTPEHISQYPRGTTPESRYSDIKITGFRGMSGSALVRGFFEVKSHKSERTKDLTMIARLPYQISELQKETEKDDFTRAFIICGRYTLSVPEMLEFENVLPHYTLDIYEVDAVDGAILTDVNLEEMVEAFVNNRDPDSLWPRA